MVFELHPNYVCFFKEEMTVFVHVSVVETYNEIDLIGKLSIATLCASISAK